MAERDYDVVVVGAGIIGSSAARALSDAGLRVAVVDPVGVCVEASSAAAGLLTPQLEGEHPGPLFELLERGRAVYMDFVAALREETGIDVELRREGTLVLALRDEDEAALVEQERWQRDAGLRVERLDGERARELEPLIGPETRWALYLPEDVQVDNVKVCRALSRTLQERGVTVLIGDPVLEVGVRGDAVTGVKLSSGAWVGAERVVLAAGAWTGHIQGLPRPIPVRPVRGQMMALTGVTPPACRTLATPRGYIVPRLDGRHLAGSTEEEAGFEKSPTVGGVLSISRNALEIAPGLADARIEDVWVGLRPGTPDGCPVLGEDPTVRGLTYATGHFRNGILLAPVTAQIVAELVTGRTPKLELSAFAPDRFEDGS